MDNPAFDGKQTHKSSSIVNEKSKLKSGLPKSSELNNKDAESDTEKVSLKRTIGILSCVGIVVGTIIGSGIFISPKGVLLGTGSIGVTLIVWLICGFFAFMGSWTCAELGLLIPSSGGQYMYFLEGFAQTRKKEKLFWGPLVGFLYMWQQILFGRPAGGAVQAMACATYLIKLSSLECLNDIENKGNDLAIKLLAATIIILITTINCYSVRSSTRLINILTASKLFALIAIITGGIITYSQGTNQALGTGFEGTTFNFEGIALAFYSGLWAYAGWDNLNMIPREIINPEKNLPKALAISCSLVTVIYLLTNISYFIVMSKSDFLNSQAVAVDFSSIILGKFGSVFMVLSVALSIFGSMTGGTLVANRATYAAAREGHLVDTLSYLHIRHMTPSAALIFSCALSLFAIANSNILSLIFLLGFLDSIFLFILMVALLVMRKTKKDVKRTIKVPLFVPIIVMIFALGLVVTPLISKPNMEYFYVILMLLVGVAIYTPFVYYEIRIPGLEKIKRYLQITFEIGPPEDDEI